MIFKTKYEALIDDDTDTVNEVAYNIFGEPAKFIKLPQPVNEDLRPGAGTLLLEKTADTIDLKGVELFEAQIDILNLGEPLITGKFPSSEEIFTQNKVNLEKLIQLRLQDPDLNKKKKTELMLDVLEYFISLKAANPTLYAMLETQGKINEQTFREMQTVES